MKRYYSYDEANGACAMLNAYSQRAGNGRPYYIKRHWLRRGLYGEIAGYTYTIHKRRATTSN